MSNPDHRQARTRTLPSLMVLLSLLLSLVPAGTSVAQGGGAILTARFGTDAEGFTYQSDAFDTASASGYDQGDWTPFEGYDLSGALQVALGGGTDEYDNSTVNDMSGGWQRTFTLDQPADGVVLWFGHNLAQTGFYESDEYTQVRVTFDGAPLGVPCTGGATCVHEIAGNGQGSTESIRTGWQVFQADLGILLAGDHTLLIGGYNNQKSISNESSAVLIDNLVLASGNAPPLADAGRDQQVQDVQPYGTEGVTLDGSASQDYDGTIATYAWSEGSTTIATGESPTVDLDAGTHTLTLTVTDDDDDTGTDQVVVTVCDWTDPAQALVCGLDMQRFKADILALNNFGDRCRYTFSECSYPSDYYQNAQDWIRSELIAMGWAAADIHEHTFYTIGPRSSLYVTKVGTEIPPGDTEPDLYIVSAHLDGRGGGGAADDNGSGSALVLEAARAFVSPGITTDHSIRFVWWDQEERGISGSGEYADHPPPPTDRSKWLGMISYDMILFDHRVPAEPNQNPSADLDVEYRAGTSFASQSAALAGVLAAGAGTYSTGFPAEVNNYSRWTDDTSFWNYCPAISVRENRRQTEVGSIDSQPRIQPYYHTTNDIYQNHTEADFLLGFNAVQMAVGTIADLTGARNGTPTAVELAAFGAEAGGEGVLFTWETATEVDLLGFYLYRAESDPELVVSGPEIRLTATLMPARAPGSPVGANYQYLDASAQAGGTYDYWLEIVDVRGTSERHGPVAVALPAKGRVLLPLLTR